MVLRERVVLMAVLTMSTAAFSQVTITNDIVVVQDPQGAITNLVATMGSPVIFPSPQEQFCRAAFNAARAGGLADEFDGIISFSTSEDITDLSNVWQGSPVRADGSGYGRANSPVVNTYNSIRVSQCVFMGTLGRTAAFIPGFPRSEPLPANPDAAWRPSIGVPIPIDSLTGIEMLGHEYGHHWLLGVEFDQNDGRGRQHFIRGYSESNSEGGGGMGSPNQHYSAWADSRSVMYGSCITDNGNGSFTLKGCQRKYSEIDQYLMGLRGPNEVSPMMVLENPSDPGKGVDSIPPAANASGTTVNATRHDVTADEIIRAMGARIPAVPVARNCWRVAFVVVLKPGETTVPPAMMNKIQAYKNRWGPWFNFATDGRGTMDTRIMGNGCASMPPPDAGVPMMPDAGQPEVDAGIPDAGAEEVDAGVIEMDAGVEVPDAGTEQPMGGGTGTTSPTGGGTGIGVEPGTDTRKITDGCGCSAGTEPLSILAFLGLLLVRRRAQR